MLLNLKWNTLFPLNGREWETIFLLLAASSSLEADRKYCRKGGMAIFQVYRNDNQKD